MNSHKYILTIAGHDPCGGAGISSDIKTFDAHGLYGLSVCTAITIQNDINFQQCHWINLETIMTQIDCLIERFEINTVKIGIIESWVVLTKILNKLHEINASIKIILDPVLKSSTGFQFHTTKQQLELDNIWSLCEIITPNYDEIQDLYPELSLEKTLQHIGSFTNIHLKGGHRLDKPGWDELHHSKTITKHIPPTLSHVSEKHGSGCVLSSALACNLELGVDLEKACRNAKRYTEHFLNSHPSLLGIHNNLEIS